MNRDLFNEWLFEFEEKCRRERREILLLLDNFSGHEVEVGKLSDTVLTRGLAVIYRGDKTPKNRKFRRFFTAKNRIFWQFITAKYRSDFII